MNYRPKLQLPPPTDWTDFETLCWGLWRVIWADSSAQKNGRRGQPQHGVDVYGRSAKGSVWAGVQCKGKENFTDQKLTKAEVSKEVGKAKRFKPKLIEYTIATTAPKDVALQEHARKITDGHKKTGRFGVAVCGWDDIEDLLYEYEPPVARQFYPLVFGGELGTLLRIMVDRLPEPSGFTPVSPPETTFVTAVAQGASVSRPSDDRQVRAKDVRSVLPFLSSVHQELLRQSSENDATSSDASLTAAVDRAIVTGRDARLRTDREPV